MKNFLVKYKRISVPHTCSCIENGKSCKQEAVSYGTHWIKMDNYKKADAEQILRCELGVSDKIKHRKLSYKILEYIML